MELCNSAVFLFVIGLLWAILLFISFKKISHQKEKGDSRMLFSGFLMFIGLALIFIAGATAFEYMESPEFCGTVCHVMEPYYESYDNPGVNNSFMLAHSENEVTCANCHNEPGIGGTAKGLAAGIAESAIYVTGTYDEDNLGEFGSRDACLKCHDGSVTINGKTAMIPKDVTIPNGTSTNPHLEEKDCVDCHTSHTVGIGLTEEACLVCHGTDGTDFPNFSENIEKHEVTTFEFLRDEEINEDCMSCHNREHDHIITDTPNERIPFNTSLINAEFCSDCHDREYAAYESFDTLDSEGIYDYLDNDCDDCHTEHKIIPKPPHTSDPPYNSCESCHNDISEKTIHDRTEIIFTNISFIEEDFCGYCHEAEFAPYDSSFTPVSKEIYGANGCLNCHNTGHDLDPIDHPHQTSTPFDDCTNCHSNYPDEIHDRKEISFLTFLNETDIENNFCGSCHEGETERLDDGRHSSFDCTDCHGDHAETSINFDDDCRFCHDNVEPPIPNSHESSTSCSSSCHDHDTTKIHSEK